MEMKKILMGFGILILIIVLYRYFFSDPTVTNLLTLGSAKEMITKPSTQLTGNAESVDFTYSVWVYVKDWNYKLGQNKSIIEEKVMEKYAQILDLTKTQIICKFIYKYTPMLVVAVLIPVSCQKLAL